MLHSGHGQITNGRQRTDYKSKYAKVIIFVVQEGILLLINQ